MQLSNEEFQALLDAPIEPNEELKAVYVKHRHYFKKTGEEPLKRCSSRLHVIALDQIDCCLNCIRRRVRHDKSWKNHRKTKYRELKNV